MAKIAIRRQHHQIMADAELREQRVDRSNLDAGATALVAQLRRVHMVLAIRRQEGQSGESIQNLGACLGTLETLQQFLKDEAGSDEGFTAPDCADQLGHFWHGRLPVAPKG